jgi:glutamyl-tRNA synthetase
MTTPIVTRFAPSPTGFLHIGGARTALFNWLFARHHGGKMLLRIEDTDRKRSTQEAVNAIFEGLGWLGLHADDEPVFQSQRQERHAEVARELLDKGQAYRCYLSSEELQQLKEEARAEKRAFISPWREQSSDKAPAGAPFVVRLKTPQTGQTIIEDQVQGSVTFDNSDMDDLVLLRADGTPTYMLAVVVDDHDMQVTHIIRGDDHLINAARQKLIYEAMGWSTPVFAHIPLIHGSDGAKLSKRHGALGVEAYRAMGYLPQAMLNYLARLGWSPKQDEDIFSLEQAVAWFDVSRLGKSPARLDLQKLDHINAHYIRQSDDAELLQTINSSLEELVEEPIATLVRLPLAQERLLRAMSALKQRSKTLKELLQQARFLYWTDPLPFEEKAEQALSDEIRPHLQAAYDALTHVSQWDKDTLEAALTELAQAKDVKFGKIAQPLRAALTGQNASPGVYDVLTALGREASLQRLQAVLQTHYQ